MTTDAGNKEFQNQGDQQFDDGSNADWSDDAFTSAPPPPKTEFAEFDDEPSSPEEAAADAQRAEQEQLLEHQIAQQKADDTPEQSEVETTESPELQDPPEGEEPQSGLTFSEETLRMAGMTAEEAGRFFKDEEALKAQVAWQDHQSMLAANQVPGQQRSNAPAQQHRFQQQQQQIQMPVQPYQQAPQQQSQQALPESQPFVVDLDPEVWGEQTVEFLNRMNSHYQEQMQSHAARTQQLENALLGVHGAMTQQAVERKFEEFDNKVNALPKEYAETFGKGNRRTLKGTPQFEARIRLNNAIQAIASGRALQGMPPLDESQLFDRALRVEFSKQQESIVRDQAVEQVTRRAKQMTARPTNRQGKPKTAASKAQENVDKFLREKGIIGGNIHEEIDEL